MMKRRKRWLTGILAAFLLATVIQPVPTKAEAVQPVDTTVSEAAKTTEEQEQIIQNVYEMTVDSNTGEGWPEGPKTYGEAGIVMDAESGAILYSKNIDGKAYPASITKILTMLVALENANLDDIVTITEESVYCVEYGYAHIGLQTGEEISLKDALYAVMLASANEAAYAVGASVGESVGEDYDWFIQEMNNRCRELGGFNSNFVNTNGMDDENHYTTARDMALITSELLVNHPEFVEICQTMQYTIPPTNKVSESRTFQQKHQMFYEGSEYYNPNVIAGKTGYTDTALNTLVTCATDGEKELVCVVLKVHGRNVYTDTQALLDYGFDNFEKVDLASQGITKDIESFEEGAYILLPSGAEFEDVEVEITPDGENKSTGTAVYSYKGNLAGTAKITFSDSYMKENSSEAKLKDGRQTIKEKIPSWVKYIVIVIITVVLFYIWISVLVLICRIRKEKARRRRRRRRSARRRSAGGQKTRQQAARRRQAEGHNRRHRSRL